MDTSGATEPVFDFYPRPPRGGRPATHGGQTGGSTFLSTPSARRATRAQCTVIRKKRFLSTPSARRATPPWVAAPRRALFLSTPSARRATKAIDDYTMQLIISIHALREEGDALGDLPKNALVNFYPRPPRGGRRAGIPPSMRVSEFLSTPSARRATYPQRASPPQPCDFYPRPPRGGRRTVSGNTIQAGEFLSTPSARRATPACAHPVKLQGFLSTPSARRATTIADLLLMFGKFLSTPSARRATSSGCAIRTPCWYFYPRPPRGGRPPGTMPETLSIHFYPRPPRGGRLQTCLFFFSFKHFYPRPPRGGRLIHRHEGAAIFQFLSTPSARRATSYRFTKHPSGTISIHALREEGDGRVRAFQQHPRISIHALREEGDEVCGADRRICEISIHALREEGDRHGTRRARRRWHFYPRPPRGGRRSDPL